MKKQIVISLLFLALYVPTAVAQKNKKELCLPTKGIIYDADINKQVARVLARTFDNYCGYHALGSWYEIQNYAGYVVERVAEVDYVERKEDTLCKIQTMLVVQRMTGAYWGEPVIYIVYESKVPTPGAKEFSISKLENLARRWKACDCIETETNWLGKGKKTASANNENSTPGKLKDGPYEEKHSNGNVKIKGQIKDGKQDGKWEEYYPSGKLKKEGTYINGVEEGTESLYKEDGTLVMKSEYANSKKNGKELIFKDDVVYVSLMYKDDKVNGEGIMYDKEGNKESLEIYKDGKLNGPFKKWKGGKITSEGAYKDNIKDGLWIEYDEQGKITSQVKWKDGIKE